MDKDHGQGEKNGRAGKDGSKASAGVEHVLRVRATPQYHRARMVVGSGDAQVTT